ncbi:hypothetical protein [Endobacterium cereale]|uniref:hypothetical protein n=1 Tax=Endobacterium cereale TaxID=2663029 RepID=UPI001AD950D7|nr:hypothetical protein [Endobacterium cereale]MEB2846761.1 hypothetical protein [Endobacterium cereale]
MDKKLNRVYKALIKGAADGRAGTDLHDFVTDKCLKTSSKRIVKASLMALTDPDVRKRYVLEAIFDLAIKYRLSSLGVEEDTVEDDKDDGKAPSISSELKSKLHSSASVAAIADGVAEALPPRGQVH